MSPSWIWSDKRTNERVARVGYNYFISNMGEWNNCFSKFSNRVLLPSFISTVLQGGKILNLAHYFPYDVKLRLLAHSRSFLANQKARNAIVGAENLLNIYRHQCVIRYHIWSLLHIMCGCQCDKAMTKNDTREVIWYHFTAVKWYHINSRFELSNQINCNNLVGPIRLHVIF